MTGGWSGGDYATAGDAWAPAAADVTAAALSELGGTATGPASRVLDVGTGTGPAALAAARAGAAAVGLDREPGLLMTARQRARSAGLAATTCFAVGDALQLPFPDGTFDAVLSTFGVMFAPDARRAAAELVRVCRPGGIVAVASWTPDGVMGRIAPTVTRHLDRPPAAPAPTRWGDPAHIRAWFAPLPVAIRTRVAHVRITYPSVRHAVAVFENKPGPLRAHRCALRALGRWDDARAELAALFAAHNRSTGADLVFDAPYLLALGRVHGPQAGGG
ncbi:class I SAM-dependent methyltransferase [Streptomyces collinus]|uniref:class I SAM-dependent methyltransferase n=1 Tax=Streptomyces collinus TaxID=42684 RepID=UPI0033FA866F